MAMNNNGITGDVEDAEDQSAASTGLEKEDGSSAVFNDLVVEAAPAAALDNLDNEEASVDESTDGCAVVTETALGTSNKDNPATKSKRRHPATKSKRRHPATKSKRRNYDVWVREAITKLQEVNGSSYGDIVDYIKDTYDVQEADCKQQVGIALNKGVNKTHTLKRNKNENLYKLASKTSRKPPSVKW